MQFQTPSSLSMSISPSPTASDEHDNKSCDELQTKISATQAASVCPVSGAVASSSSSAMSCPFASSSSSSSSSSRTQTDSSTPHHTCPFAAAIPASRRPVLQTQPDGNVIEVPRRCPKWVRVLRFSAKFIAKQVVMRTAKKALVILYKSLRHQQQQQQLIERDDSETETASHEKAE